MGTAAGGPDRCVNTLSDNIRIDKDARAYGSAHDQHGGVKKGPVGEQELAMVGTLVNSRSQFFRSRCDWILNARENHTRQH